MSQFMILHLVCFRQNFVRDIILYFCLKTDSSRSVVWRPREIPERSCFRVVSRKSGMYRYSYRIHGRCFRYKGLFPHPSPFALHPPSPSLVARRITVSKSCCPRSFRTPSSRGSGYPERGESPHQKVPRPILRRGYRAPLLCARL